MMKLSVCFVVLFAVYTSAYKTGAPEMACKTIEPKHKDWKSQTTASPFKIEAKKNGDMVDVTISGSEKFKGFLLVARDASNKNVGTWELVDKAKLLKCDNDNDAITHQSNEEKDSIKLKWKIPSGLDAGSTICFRGAIVKNGKTFWTNQKSNSVTI